jgi:uncharacterized protein YbjT (DUF2867 family)
LRILVLGASGLIGSAVCARLVAEGHAVIGISRSRAIGLLASVSHFRLDIARTTRAEDWVPFLEGIDAVVNCAGVLQDAPGDSTRGLHTEGAAALFAACERQQVRRIVHLSAAGVDRALSSFSKTKRTGDAILAASSLEWFILRPSVVIGRAAYGGSALFRGLAALSVLPAIAGTGPLQLVHLDDVVETVVLCLRPETPARRILELVGPRRWTFPQTIDLFRRWMGWRPAVVVPVPDWAASLIYRAGDAISWLGWRPPVRTTAQKEIAQGATGDPARWQEATGISVKDIEAALVQEPASVQERWFARLYLLKAVVFAVLGTFWLATGMIAVGPGFAAGVSLVREAGIGEALAAASVIAGGLADMIIGAAIVYRPTSRAGLYAGLAISLAYAIIGTYLLPRLWSDPLGPLVKILPIVVLIAVALAIREDR